MRSADRHILLICELNTNNNPPTHSFGGEVVTPELMDPDYKEAKKPWDRDAFLAANNWETRKAGITSFAKALKSESGFKKVGTIGFCWGGGAVLKLGAKGLFWSPLFPTSSKG